MAAKRKARQKTVRKKNGAASSSHTAGNQQEDIDDQEDTSFQPSADVFISYSHKDRFWMDWLLADRMLLTTSGTVEVWSDEEIQPSDDWQEEINKALADAQVAVLLVSKNFLDSEFIKNKELPKILQNRKKKKAAVFWIPLEDNLEKKLPKALSDIQAVLSPQNSLKKILEEQSTETLTSIREQIHDKIRRALDPIGWRVSKVLDRKYEVIRKLGEGATRCVFKGRDHIMKRWVAIMALKNAGTTGSDRSDQLEEFRHSLLFASRVDDIECFLTIYDAWLDRNPPLCVRQYAEGQNLKVRLRSGGLRFGYVRDILLSLARGLDVAHTRGFVHLNIKPSNVIIDDQDRAYLSPLSRRPNYYDQVKAKWKDLDQEDRAYVVPEFFDRGVPNISLPKCDQYLLGMLGYHMIVGGEAPCRVSVKGSTYPQSLRQFKLLPEITDPACPEALIEVVMRMSQRNPEDRYERLGEAIERLGNFRDESLSQARDSYRRIASSGLEEKLFKEFYQVFRKKITSEPAIEIFGKMKKGDWERQYEMLREALVLLLAFNEFDTPGGCVNPSEPTVLSRTRRSHQAFEIPLVDYQEFANLLIDKLTSIDPGCKNNDAVEDCVRRAWERALAPGLKYMAKNAT